jgi:hypothetical protein
MSVQQAKYDEDLRVVLDIELKDLEQGMSGFSQAARVEVSMVRYKRMAELAVKGIDEEILRSDIFKNDFNSIGQPEKVFKTVRYGTPSELEVTITEDTIVLNAKGGRYNLFHDEWLAIKDFINTHVSNPKDI